MNKENEKNVNENEEVKIEATTAEASAPEAKEVKTEPTVEKVQENTEASKKNSTAQNSDTKRENPRAARSPERNPKGKRFKREGSNDSKADGPEMIEKVISVKRITKVTKGGKKLSFSALVVVGDGKNKVGYSLTKASEVAVAIRKAMVVAKKNMITVPLRGTTITHEVIGRCSGSRVLLKPAADGTGVIASSPVRAVCDGAGIHNILTKCHRSNNPINVVKATIEGLSRLKSVENKEG